MKKVTNDSFITKYTNRKATGITLIALVITIIVLLILAGISISAVTQTGIFGKAKQAEQKSKDAQELENLTLADYENKIDSKYQGEISSNRDNTTGNSYTILFEGTINNGETKDLTDSISNYKKLSIRYNLNSAELISYANIFYDYDFLKPNSILNVDYNSDNTSYYIAKYIVFPTSNTVKCTGSWVGSYNPNTPLTIFGFKNY